MNGIIKKITAAAAATTLFLSSFTACSIVNKIDEDKLLNGNSLTKNNKYINYSISYPGINNEKYPDTTGNMLCDGVFSQGNEPDLKKSVGVTINNDEEKFNNMPCHFSLNIDLITKKNIEGGFISFVRNDYTSFPEKIEFYASEDGVNYSFIAEGTKFDSNEYSVKYGFQLDKKASYKNIRINIYQNEFINNKININIDEFNLIGSAETDIFNASSSSEYEISAKKSKYTDTNNSKLTDSEFLPTDLNDAPADEFLTNLVTLKPINQNKFNKISFIIDLKKQTNIKFISMNFITSEFFKSELPKSMIISIGNNKESLKKYAIGNIIKEFGSINNSHTVIGESFADSINGRYVKFDLIMNSENSQIATDGFNILGCENNVINTINPEIISNPYDFTNIALNKPITCSMHTNDNISVLTDNLHANSMSKNEYVSFGQLNNKKIEFTIDLQNKVSDIAGFLFEISEFADTNAAKPTVKVYASNDNKNFKEIGILEAKYSSVGNIDYLLELEKHISARYIKFTIRGNNGEDLFVGNISVYQKELMKPTIRNSMGSIAELANTNNIDYSNIYLENEWKELFLYMKKHGINEFYLDYCADEKNKNSIIPNLTGYNNVTEKCIPDETNKLDAIVNAAQYAGVKLYFGGLLSENFTNTINNKDEYIKRNMEIYQYIYKNYSNINNDKSNVFGGFIISDKISDELLSKEDNVHKTKSYLSDLSKQMKNSFKNTNIINIIEPTLKLDAAEFYTKINYIYKKQNENLADIIIIDNALKNDDVDIYVLGELLLNCDYISNAVRTNGMKCHICSRADSTNVAKLKSSEKFIDSLIASYKQTNINAISDIILNFNYLNHNCNDFNFLAREYFVDRYNDFYFQAINN